MPRIRPGWLSGSAPLAAAFLLGLLPVLPIWMGGHPILLNDMLVAYYAYFQDFHRNWSWDNPLPLWSSSYQGGMPMHAYWQSAYLYPLTWILFGPFSPLHTIYLFYALHFALAIAGFLVLGPALSLRRPASFWSGIAFGLSGTMLARYEHPTFLAGWAYLPLVLGLYLRLERAPSLGGIAGLAIALSLQTLGGHPQATAATAILLGLFFLRGLFLRGFVSGKTRPFSRDGFLATGAPAAAALAAGLLCLPLFLPFLDFLGQAERFDGAAHLGKGPQGEDAGEKLSHGVFAFENFSTGGMRPVHFLSLAMPRALGSPAHASWWGGEPWGEVFLFIGAAGLLACFFASPHRMNPRLRWLLLCGAIGLWMAFGAHLFASQILYHVPGLNNFRRPARWSILFVLALAGLSGHGFQRWAGGARLHSRVLAALAIAAGGGFLAAATLAAQPAWLQALVDWLRQIRPLDPAKDYSAKLLILTRDWRWDFAFFLGAVLLLAGRGIAARGLAMGPPRGRIHLRLASDSGARSLARILALVLPAFLAADLLRQHWSHFHRFPRDYYRRPPATLPSLDMATLPFWRVETYLEYPGTEMWEMHHDPLRRMDLFEREKNALNYGIHAVFGIRHVGAHMPLVWPWDPALTPGGKAARYLLSNRGPEAFGRRPLRFLARHDSVRVYEILDWKPRIQILKATGDSVVVAEACPEGFSGHGGLCVREPGDGLVQVRGRFAAGDTLVFRERWHRGWRLRTGSGSWEKPRRAGDFMSLVFEAGAEEVEWRF